MWLLEQGVAPEQISWVMPRDSWIVNRVTTQNGPEFFDEAIGGALRQLQALAEQAKTLTTCFSGSKPPGKCCALIPRSRRACATLPPSRGRGCRAAPHPAHHPRGARAGHQPRRPHLASGATVRMPANTSTSTARRPPSTYWANNELIFQPGKIVPELVRAAAGQL